jgi:hypothetical protein
MHMSSFPKTVFIISLAFFGFLVFM